MLPSLAKMTAGFAPKMDRERAIVVPGITNTVLFLLHLKRRGVIITVIG